MPKNADQVPELPAEVAPEDGSAAEQPQAEAPAVAEAPAEAEQPHEGIIDKIEDVVEDVVEAVEHAVEKAVEFVEELPTHLAMRHSDGGSSDAYPADENGIVQVPVAEVEVAQSHGFVPAAPDVAE